MDLGLETQKTNTGISPTLVFLIFNPKSIFGKSI